MALTVRIRWENQAPTMEINPLNYFCWELRHCQDEEDLVQDDPPQVMFVGLVIAEFWVSETSATFTLW